MIAAEIARAAASTTDYTPAAIGLIGTLIGASIGLAFNSFSHKEQKRRHLNEKVVEFLRHADAIRAAFNDVYTSDFDHDTSPDAVKKREEANRSRVQAARTSEKEAKIVLDYIGLTADRRTFWVARATHQSIKNVLAAVSLHVTQGATLHMDALFGYGDARSALVSHLTPRGPGAYGPRMLWTKFSAWSARHAALSGEQREPAAVPEDIVSKRKEETDGT